MQKYDNHNGKIKLLSKDCDGSSFSSAFAGKSTSSLPFALIHWQVRLRVIITLPSCMMKESFHINKKFQNHPNYCFAPQGLKHDHWGKTEMCVLLSMHLSTFHIPIVHVP